MADIHFNCPLCGATLTASPPTKRGEHTNCPSCDRPIIVPRKLHLKPILLFLFMAALIGIVVSRYLPSGEETAEDNTTEAPSPGDAPDPRPDPGPEPEPEPETAQVAPDAPEAADRVEGLTPGMTRGEVLLIMGRPGTTYGRGKKEYWQYGPWEMTFIDGKLSEKIKRAQ